MTSIDGHIYINGHRVAAPRRLEDAASALHANNAVAWIGLHSPEPTTLKDAAILLVLNALAVEYARKGHQRAKLECYGDTMFVVLPSRDV
jgi:magnesium transporter